MDRKAFISALERLATATPDIPMRVGDGLLHCGTCGRTLRAVRPRQSGYGPPAMNYLCEAGDCGRVRARAERVDHRLQEVARQRLADRSPTAEWQRARFVLIDAELAEPRTLWAWYADQRHRRQVAQAHAWWRNPLVLLLLPFGFTSRSVTRGELYKLGNRLAGRVLELAGRPASSAGRALLERLCEARSAYTAAWLDDPVRPSLAGRRLDEAQDRFWPLLTDTNWHDLGPAESPLDDRALALDWAKAEMLPARRVLLRLAAGTNRLVVHGTAGDEPTVTLVGGAAR